MRLKVFCGCDVIFLFLFLKIRFSSSTIGNLFPSTLRRDDHRICIGMDRGSEQAALTYCRDKQEVVVILSFLESSFSVVHCGGGKKNKKYSKAIILSITSTKEERD